MDPAHFLVAQDSSAICPSFTHFLLFTPVLILFHCFRPWKEKTLSPFFQRAAQKAFTNFPDKKTRGDVFLSLSRISSPSGGSRKTPPNSTPWKPVFSHPFFHMQFEPPPAGEQRSTCLPKNRWLSREHHVQKKACPKKWCSRIGLPKPPPTLAVTALKGPKKELEAFFSHLTFPLKSRFSCFSFSLACSAFNPLSLKSRGQIWRRRQRGRDPATRR